MSEIIKRRKCTCDCGNTHIVEERVIIEEMPIGVEATITPNSEDSGWEVTIVDFINPKTFCLPADDMRGALWIVNNVAKPMCQKGYQFVVANSTTRFATHNQIHAVKLTNLDTDDAKSTKRKEHWYEEVVRKASRQAVMNANASYRNGYKK